MALTPSRGKKVYTGVHVDAYFDMDYPGITRYALRSDELADALGNIAEAGRAYAQAQSPRGKTRDGEGPAYADSWVVVPYIETRVGNPPFPRGAYTLANTSAHALAVEFGNGTAADPGHRVFAKTLDFLHTYGRSR